MNKVLTEEQREKLIFASFYMLKYGQLKKYGIRLRTGLIGSLRFF